MRPHCPLVSDFQGDEDGNKDCECGLSIVPSIDAKLKRLTPQSRDDSYLTDKKKDIN